MNLQREHKYEFRRHSAKSKGRCPSCGHRGCFVYYVWRGTDKIVREDLGRCDHESSCGYHVAPWHLSREEQDKLKSESGLPSDYTPPPPPPEPTVEPLNKDLVIQSEVITAEMKYRGSTLTDYLLHVEGMPLKELADSLIKYHVGTTRNGSSIWWQIDDEGRVRSGKIMRYKEDGHRSKKDEKDFGTWVHSELKKRGVLSKDWSVVQCLFGLHLISRSENVGKPVAIVESEKTAVICSVFKPEYIWLATGGKGNLQDHKLNAIIKQKRHIYVFPDLDGYEKWNKRVQEIKKNLHYDYISVSNWVKKNATEADGGGCDIADIILRRLKDKSEADRVAKPVDDAKKALNDVEKALRLETPHAVLRALVNGLELEIITE